MTIRQPVRRTKDRDIVANDSTTILCQLIVTLKSNVRARVDVQSFRPRA
jgi:hypothetical protein